MTDQNAFLHEMSAKGWWCMIIDSNSGKVGQMMIAAKKRDTTYAEFFKTATGRGPDHDKMIKVYTVYPNIVRVDIKITKGENKS